MTCQGHGVNDTANQQTETGSDAISEWWCGRAVEMGTPQLEIIHLKLFELMDRTLESLDFGDAVNGWIARARKGSADSNSTDKYIY